MCLQARQEGRLLIRRPALIWKGGRRSTTHRDVSGGVHGGHQGHLNVCRDGCLPAHLQHSYCTSVAEHPLLHSACLLNPTPSITAARTPTPSPCPSPASARCPCACAALKLPTPHHHTHQTCRHRQHHLLLLQVLLSSLLLHRTRCSSLCCTLQQSLLLMLLELQGCCCLCLVHAAELCCALRVLGVASGCCAVWVLLLCLHTLLPIKWQSGAEHSTVCGRQ